MVVETKLDELVDFKREYLLGMRNFLFKEAHSYISNTWGENVINLDEEYESYKIVLVDNDNIIAKVKRENSKSNFTIYFGSKFLLSVYTLVTGYYSLRKESNHEEIAILDKKTILDIVEDQRPYEFDDWNFYGEALDYDHYIIAKENISYIVLLVLYHELSHLSNGHYEFIDNFKKNENKNNFNIDFKRFIEVDADISAAFNFARRTLSYPLTNLPGNIPFEYPKSQVVYFILGSIGLLFSLEDIIANRRLSVEDYYDTKEYRRYKYPHPIVRCNLTRIYLNIAIDKMRLEGMFNEDLAELMRFSGRSIILSVSKFIGFEDDRWDLHGEYRDDETETIQMLNWYFDKKDIILEKIKQICNE